MLSLTYEQQFELRRMQDAEKELSKDQLIKLIIDAKTLLATKTKVSNRLAESLHLKQEDFSLDTEQHLNEDWSSWAKHVLFAELIDTMTMIMMRDNIIRYSLKTRVFN